MTRSVKLTRTNPCPNIEIFRRVKCPAEFFKDNKLLYYVITKSLTSVGFSGGWSVWLNLDVAVTIVDASGTDIVIFDSVVVNDNSTGSVKDGLSVLTVAGTVGSGLGEAVVCISRVVFVAVSNPEGDVDIFIVLVISGLSSITVSFPVGEDDVFMVGVGVVADVVST